jgi:hypothetical protein
MMLKHCAGYASLLLVLSHQTAASVTDAPCLCIFDVDRTLTGKQGDTKKHCPHNKKFPSIHDQAFGGGNLTLSELAVHLDQTFCVHCYAGIISSGHAGGLHHHSKMQTELVKVLNAKKMKHLQVADAWSVHGAPDGKVTAPLVLGCVKGKKHECAYGIREWYNGHEVANKLAITPFNTHFFDDVSSNIELFKGSGYNARQVSCKSRDNTQGDKIGWCGGLTEECVADKGIYLCDDAGAESRVSLV